MSLREDLARRLCNVAEGTSEGVIAHEYRYLADEVIRLMKWAQHCGDYDPDSEGMVGPLTLPPIGWEP